MYKNKNIQKGGADVLGALILIGENVLKILITVFTKLTQGFMIISKIEPPSDPTTPWYYLSEYNWGYLWLFLYYSVKAIMYVVIFTLGGPIAVIVGIIYMYMKLYNNVKNN